MDGKEFYKYSKACIDNNIKIYPKCSNSGKYKIIINRNGEEKIGDQYYEDQPSVRIKEVNTPRGIQKIKERIPSVWNKILELYKATCIKNNLLNN